MVNLFKTRRKSAGNVFEEVENEKYGSPEPPAATAAAATAAASSGGFKVLSQTEIAAKKELALRKQLEKEKPKFGRFGGFGNGNKSRQQSMDDDLSGSSKRNSDSKSSSGTSGHRPYPTTGQFGSTSTLPSSADTDYNDNMFANLPPRPAIAQHSSSPSSFSINGMKKALPQIPAIPHHQGFNPSASHRYYSTTEESVTPSSDTGRSRAMTTSSYASTAIPPKLDSDLNFGGGFDDLFSGLDRRRDSPELMENSAGRSLLSGKRATHPEPIDINRKLDVEPPLASWESRGSGEHLMSPSPIDESEDNTPPPPPPHKYAPIASAESPVLNGSSGFQDADANIVRRSVASRRSANESSPEPKPLSYSSSAVSLQTPLSSRTGSHDTTPKAAVRSSVAASHDDDDNLFAPVKLNDTPAQKTVPLPRKENLPAPPTVAGDSGRKVMTAAEFQALKQQRQSQPVDNDSSDEDYEDEEDAIRQREEEELKMRRKQQQMQIAREALRRSTTAPSIANGGRPESGVGFPSEASLQADEWDDEDVPLGMLAHHLPAKQNVALSTTPNPSYLPERPASAGALGGNRVSTAYRPAFARNLPEDPFASQFVGGGLVRQGNRESMGFGRAASVYGEPMGSNMSYAEPTPQFPTLVGQIQMRESSKQKYGGGASSKNPAEGPFTGALGAQMNGMNQPATRMSQMPMQGQMQGQMQGMNPMMNMMNGGMMGMGYPMQNQNAFMQDPQYQQMQQMLMAQQNMLMQMQAQQQMFNQQMPQDPRMSMFPQQMQNFQAPGFANNSTPNLNAPMQNQRPMSIMSGFGNQQSMQQGRPFSAVVPGAQGPGQFGQNLGLAPGPAPGYTASIAPSERSNIGMSSRYRPVTTGNGLQDHMSTVSSQTLQPTMNGSDPKKVKGILKNKVTTSVTAVREDDEDDWSKMKARKSKFVSNTNAGAKNDNSTSLGDFDARVVF